MRYARFELTLLGGAALALGVLATASAQPRAQAKRSDTITLDDARERQQAAGVRRPDPELRAGLPEHQGRHQLRRRRRRSTSSRRSSSRRGNAPDILNTSPGCGTTISVCTLAKAGDLAPMVKQAVGEAVAAARHLGGQVRRGALLVHPGRLAVRHVHERRPVQEARAEDPADVPAAPRRSAARRRRPARSRSLCAAAELGVVANLVTELAVASLYAKDQQLGEQAQGRHGELRRDARLAPGAPDVRRHERRRLLPARGDGHDVHVRDRAVRAGAGPDGAGAGGDKGVDRRREARSSPTRTTRSRTARPTQTHSYSWSDGRLTRRQRARERAGPGGRADVHRLRRPAEAERALRADDRRADPVPVPAPAAPELHVRTTRPCSSSTDT